MRASEVRPYGNGDGDGKKEHHPVLKRRDLGFGATPIRKTTPTNYFSKTSNLPPLHGRGNNGASQSAMRASEVRPYGNGKKEHHPVLKRHDLGFGATAETRVKCDKRQKETA
jgi:hypothetical protein